jgi:hypothetical protein
MRITTRSAVAAAVLGTAALFCGCSSSGYPNTDDRVENIDTTIKKGGLAGRGNESRDQRFEKEVSKSPSVPAESKPPSK